MKVCLDASMVIKWLVNEEDSDKALQWLRARVYYQFVGPAFLPLEVASVLGRKMCRKVIDKDECVAALEFFERLDIVCEWEPDLLKRAFEVAVELDMPTVYDAAYLAVAEKAGCELWTADAQFVRVAKKQYPFVRFVGEERT